MNLHDYYFGLAPEKRERLAAKLDTTVGYLERLAGGFRLPSLRFAVRMNRATKGAVSLDGIIETYERKNGRV